MTTELWVLVCLMVVLGITYCVSMYIYARCTKKDYYE